jgi:diguanylate cyclase (GGDEF)-like protein/PAS domain S-box-containing protein
MTSLSSDLPTGKALLNGLFSQPHVIQWLVAADGTLIELNEAALHACGHPRSEIVGRKLWEAPWWKNEPAVASKAQLFFEDSLNEVSAKAELNCQHADATNRVLALTMSQIRNEFGSISHLLVSATDITEQKKRSVIAAGQTRLLESIATNASLQTVLNETVHWVEQQGAGLSCSLLLVSEDDLTLQHKASKSLDPRFVTAVNGSKIGPNAGSCGTAAFTGRSVMTNDITADPNWDEWKEIALECGYRSCWSAPICTSKGHVLGTFAAYSNEARLPTAIEMELINTAVHIVSIAIESDSAKQKLASRERQITASELELSRVSRALRFRSSFNLAIVNSLNEAELLNQACQLAVEIGGFAAAWVGIPQHDPAKTILPVAASGKAIDYLKDLIISWDVDAPGESGRGPAGRGIRTGQTIVTTNAVDDYVFTPWRERLLRFGLKGHINLPLRHQDQSIGIFSLYLTDEFPNCPEEITLLQNLANDLGKGIVSLRLQEDQKRVLNAVSKMAASVSAVAGDSFLEQLVHNMSEALNACAAFIAEILPGTPLKAKTLYAMVDGKRVSDFSYEIEGTPCENLVGSDNWVVSTGLANQFPKSRLFRSVGAAAYIGRTLFNASGEALGQVFLLYREPLIDTGFATSTLKIFASRASAELERQAADSRIREQASLLDKAQDAILVQSLDHKVLFWNKSAERLYGWTDLEAGDSSLADLLYRNPADYYAAINTVMIQGEWSGEIEQRSKNGSLLIVEGRWNLVPNAVSGKRTILAINTDITEKKAAQAKIQTLAFYDTLTGLPNRQLLNERLKQAITSSGPTTLRTGILFIDLDNFKILNDTLGHATGDLLLKDVASRLRRCVREGDTVARLGGDEFVILLTNLDSDRPNAEIQIRAVAEKIICRLVEIYVLAGHSHHSSASVGGALVDYKVNGLDDVLKQADLAMYQAKAAGRNTFRLYEHSMQTEMVSKIELETDIRRAMANDEFFLNFQPQVDQNGRVFGAEALVRWNHPKKGLIPPIDFIPCAEESRLIIPLGRMILQKACQQLVAWSKLEYAQHLSLAVNVSVYQFRQTDFVSEVLQALTDAGANAEKLKLELTESLFVDNVDDVVEKMNLLKEAGVGFSLDDFGIGYSSLSYLKRLPLDQLKIDQSFVKDVLTDPNDAVISRSIVALGNSLGLSVIAEGVETQGQRDFLFASGCLAYQGYHFSRPISAVEFSTFLIAQS